MPPPRSPPKQSFIPSESELTPLKTDANANPLRKTCTGFPVWQHQLQKIQMQTRTLTKEAEIMWRIIEMCKECNTIVQSYAAYLWSYQGTTRIGSIASHQSLTLASEAEPCHSKGKRGKETNKRKAMNAKAYRHSNSRQTGKLMQQTRW